MSLHILCNLFFHLVRLGLETWFSERDPRSDYQIYMCAGRERATEAAAEQIWGAEKACTACSKWEKARKSQEFAKRGGGPADGEAEGILQLCDAQETQVRKFLWSALLLMHIMIF